MNDIYYYIFLIIFIFAFIITIYISYLNNFNYYILLLLIFLFFILFILFNRVILPAQVFLNDKNYCKGNYIYWITPEFLDDMSWCKNILLDGPNILGLYITDENNIEEIIKKFIKCFGHSPKYIRSNISLNKYILNTYNTYQINNYFFDITHRTI